MQEALGVTTFRLLVGRPWAPWAQLEYKEEPIFARCAYLLPPDPIAIFYSAFLLLTSPGTVHCKAKPHTVDQPWLNSNGAVESKLSTAYRASCMHRTHTNTPRTYAHEAQRPTDVISVLGVQRTQQGPGMWKWWCVYRSLKILFAQATAPQVLSKTAVWQEKSFWNFLWGHNATSHRGTSAAFHHWNLQLPLGSHLLYRTPNPQADMR